MSDDQSLILSVLMVDDDAGEAKLVKKHLDSIDEDWGLDFKHINRTDEIQDKISEETYHVMFLDYKLGARNGLEMLNEIRNSGYERPIIMLTGAGSEKVARESFRKQANDYLSKDELSPETLQESIEFVLQDFFKRETESVGESLKWFGRHDYLTSLLNRRGFIEAITRGFSDAKHLTVIFLGLQKLDRINEVNGQTAGDDVLREVAEILKDEIADEGICARLQGTDFCALLPDAGKARGNQIAEEIIKEIQENWRSFSDRNTISPGVSAVVEQSSKQVADLLDEGVRDLYKAKSGSGGVKTHG